MALAAGAAAARLRAPTQGPITPPWSCMITNLLPSLFFLLSGGLVLSKADRSAARRLGCARTMPFSERARRFPAAPSADSERTSDAAVKELRNVLCATSVSCYHGNVVSRQQGRTTLPGEGAAPGTHGRFERRTTSVALAPPKAAGRSAAHPSPLSGK